MFCKHQDERHNGNCAVPWEVSIKDHILGESLTEATRALEHDTLAHTYVLYVLRTGHQSHETYHQARPYDGQMNQTIPREPVLTNLVQLQQTVTLHHPHSAQKVTYYHANEVRTLLMGSWTHHYRGSTICHKWNTSDKM